MTSKLEKRVTAYLDKIPPAISGSGGHNQTFAVARLLAWGFRLEKPDAWQMLKFYNLACEPPWTDKDLRHKLEDAFKLGPGKQKDLR